MATTRLYTVRELEESPPEGAWELIDGELTPVNPVSLRSTVIAHRVGRIVGNYVDEHDLGLVTGADGGYVLFPNRETLRAPDVGFIRKDRIPPEEEHSHFPRLAPDLAVEVLSPSDRLADALSKISMYLEAGVRAIWLIDPIARTVTVFAPTDRMTILSDDDELDGGDVLPGFRIRVADLLG
jgi:Uma2 family endonuclease